MFFLGVLMLIKSHGHTNQLRHVAPFGIRTLQLACGTDGWALLSLQLSPLLIPHNTFSH